MSDATELTNLVNRGRNGDHGAQNELFAKITDKLRQTASAILSNEKRNNLPQATELVNECYIRMFGKDENPSFDDRTHFFVATAKQMRQILVDRIRYNGARKRLIDRDYIEHHIQQLEDRGIQLLELHEILERLEDVSPRPAQVFDLRVICEFSAAEIASLLGVSKETIYNDLKVAKMFLRRHLDDSKQQEG